MAKPHSDIRSSARSSGPLLAPIPVALALPILFAACSGEQPQEPTGTGQGSTAPAEGEGGGDRMVPIGMDRNAMVLLDGLMNPSGVYALGKDELLVCDSGNGQVLRYRDGNATALVDGLPTEYWKPGKDGAPDRFKLGPLSAVMAGPERLIVSNGGLADGEDHLLVFPWDGSSVGTPRPSNPIPPTSDDPADKGEGNFTGLSWDPERNIVWVAGQGADAKTWVLRFDPESCKLETFASADESGIAINSPMQTLPWDDDRLLVLFSGAGGKDDGLIVAFDMNSGEAVAQWTLPGLTDPMGMAVKPGTRTLAVVDNNWSLTEVQAGRLAMVTLPEGGDAAEVEIVADRLHGPVSCTFDADGALFIAELGEAFDQGKGRVLKVTGL